MDGRPGDCIKGPPPLIPKIKIMSNTNTNAKEEFLNAINEKPVKCAHIVYNPFGAWGMEDEKLPMPKELILRVTYSFADWKEFLKQLDFNYNSGYGGQELFGTVWFEDGTWMSRAEYDGLEWWQNYVVPEIPQKLL
jgi:hypothetical protein